MWKKWFGKNNIETLAFDHLDQTRIPRHIAIIMDGNGRWAQKRGLLRAFGHKAGAEALREIIRTASNMGVQVLTTYAFSTENWKRPKSEVGLLMDLIADYLESELDEMCKNNVQVRFIGRVDELNTRLQHKMEDARARTAENTGLILNLAINYGARAELTRAVQIISQQVADGKLSVADINDNIIRESLYTAGLPDPDLLIRPSGDLRISNFLLWQIAYAEIWITDTLWPDFTPEHLLQAVKDFQKRDRRFGGLKK